MSAFWALDLVCLAGVLVAAVLVVVLDNINGSIVALSAVGTLLSLLFLVLHAPDVAHSEVVVGAIALPVLYMLAVGKTRGEVGEQPELGEEGERPERQA